MKSDRDETRGNGPSRRKILECMTWAGTGVLWTVVGGVPRSAGIIDTAQAQSVKGLSFLQISDSHVGFDKPARAYVWVLGLRGIFQSIWEAFIGIR